jgi:hypothetical protein
MTILKEFKDINFVVLAEVEAEYKHSVDYKIYEIVGEHVCDGQLVFNTAGSDTNEPTDDITTAEIFAHGSVRWDGCSNWEFDIQKDCMIHACSRADLENIGHVLARCWDMTKELCPNWLT